MASRSQLRPQVEGDEDVSDYIEAESSPSYEHAVTLRRPEKPDAVRAEVVPGRMGADMPDTLERATWILRGEVDRMLEQQQRGAVDPKALQIVVDSLTKVDRSVRQWRRIQAEEVAAIEGDALEDDVLEIMKKLGRIPADDEEADDA
ncbi:MAG: hypothetical protein RLP09_09655 [Sandaracinaceae bacterium]